MSEEPTAPLPPRGKGMSVLVWLAAGVCVAGYYFCFEAVWFLYKAGPTYDAALAGELNPLTGWARGFAMWGSFFVLVIVLFLARYARWWLTVFLAVIGVGIFGGAAMMWDHAGTNHSRAFLKGIGDRMIKAGDIAALKVVAAKGQEEPERLMSPESRESLKRVLKAMPEFWIVRAQGRGDVVEVIYGRIVHVMVGPDDLDSPVGWDAGGAVNVAPGVFLIGGENEW